MSNVYYKFASELNFNHVNFDGLHISVVDLKKAILHQKRLGKATDFDLLISNAETKEEYKDENGLIPKNTSLIITRIPINNQHKKTWEVAQQAAAEAPRSFAPDVNHDISMMNGSEEDKIKVMMMQSTLDYDPTNYQRVRGNQTGDVPPNYRCYKCQKPGHWIKNCPMNPPGKEYSYKQRPESKKMTGIPRSLRDNIGNEPQALEPQFVEEKREIPEELICTICKGIFRDAVMVPCCGSSFCDDCVRTALLESEDNECPDCKEKETSPSSLIPNRFLRKSVADFLAESSNAIARESLKKEEPIETVSQQEEEEEINQDNDAENCEFPDEQIIDQPQPDEELDEISPEKHDKPSESEEEEDDDNITVTVPPPHQQSRGANFRDSRIRRIPSHGLDSQSSVRSSQDDETESFGENNSDSYSNRGAADNGSKRSNNNNDRYEIPTLGGDKNGSQNIYPIHSSSSMNSHNDYPPPQQPQQSTQNYQNPNSNQSSGMMSQMHPQSMYPQNHYQGNYYQPNQMRPMGGYDQHQGNYQQHPIRHHHHHQMHHHGQMMRPMNDNFGVRHPRPPMNNLANAVTHDIQQRYGTGYIDDPLEAFNRIMREKEMRKERFRRSPQRHSPEFRRKNFVKTRKRSRSNGTKSLSRSKSRSRSPRYRSRKDRRHNSRERRDDRRGDYRSPQRRGLNSGNVNRKSRSRSKYKTETLRHGTSAKNSLERQADKTDHGHERIDRPTDYEVNHNLDEQPPPPGDEETIQPLGTSLENADPEQSQKVRENEPESSNENSVDEKKSGKTEKSSKSESSHHHKKSRRHDTPEDSEKREKKKRKKSKEHEKEKKKSKKDKREKKHSKSPNSLSEKELKSEKTAEESHLEVDASTTIEDQIVGAPITSFEKGGSDDAHEISEQDHESREKESMNLIKRSDSILDINIDEKMDEFFPQESKWDREDDKCSEKNESFDVKTNVNEEKITHEIIKRAENAIFAKAIREIRPTSETRKKEEQSSDDARSSGAGAKKLKKSPLRASIKSRLGVKVSDDSPKPPRSKTPESRRKLPISSCIKVSTQDSRNTRGRRSRSVDKKKQSRSPKRSRSREIRAVAGNGGGSGSQRSEHPRKNSPRRTSRSRDVKPRRRTPSRSRDTRDDRIRKPREQPSGSQNRQRKHSPEPSKKQAEVKQVKSTRERESSRSKADDKKVSSTPATDEDSKKERSSRVEEDSTNTAAASKRTRTSSSSSSSSSNSEEGSENKRHKNKAKKKSQSPSAEHSSSKRKKSKKEKKAKKKKKSKK